MKILGIDPGLNNTGFGVIEAKKLKFHYKASGCIKTSGTLTDKITTIFRETHNLATKHMPDAIVIERIFMRPDRPNPESAIKLGQARGAIISAVGIINIPIFEYTANQIKKTIVGKGHAQKTQIIFMIIHLLKLKTTPPSDAADALAGALCHAYHIL